MKMSDEEAKKVLEEKLKEVEAELVSLEQRQHQLHDISIGLSSRINGLKEEKTALEGQIKGFTSRQKFGVYTERRIANNEDKYEDLSKQEADYKDRIEELNKIKNSTDSEYLKSKIDRRIEKINGKLKDLQAKKVTVSGKQRKIICSKMRRDFIKQSLLAQATGRALAFEERYKANEELRDATASAGLLRSIPSKIYDLKARHYKKKYDKAIDVVKEMSSKNSIIAMRGARVTALNKRVVDKLKHRGYSAPLPLPPAPAPAM